VQRSQIKEIPMPPVSPVSTFRLYLLRAGYLLLVVGLGLEMQVWPAVIYHVTTMELMQGVVTCMLCSLSLLAILGIRYPLQMLPLLFWEIGWKTIWLLSVALRQWSAGGLDPTFGGTLFACLFVVIFLAIVPWPYVLDTYVRKAGDPWRRRAPHPGNTPMSDAV
jgi:hypothetical protein